MVDEMKEIKFRAWDKEEKNFMYFDATDGLKSECDDTYIRLNVRKIEQYTGLKDKNGKEAYFSDLVKIDTGIYQIIWDEDYAGYFLKLVGGIGVTSGLPMFNLKEGEVIGNIHENKELLK